jgi:hypothetical protein
VSSGDESDATPPQELGARNHRNDDDIISFRSSLSLPEEDLGITSSYTSYTSYQPAATLAGEASI